MDEEWIKIYEQELKVLNIALSRKLSTSQDEDTIYTRLAIEII